MTRTHQRRPNPRNLKAGLADLDMSLRDLFVEPDGITVSAALRFLPERSYPIYYACLGELLARRCEFRARLLTIPHDVTVPIPGYGTSISTEEVQPGSVLWGWSFAAIDGDEEDFTLGLTDVCSAHSFFVAPVRGSLLRPDNTTGLYPVITAPFEFRSAEPQLKVEITNLAATDQRCQFLLYLAEPCVVQQPVRVAR